jgi:predicted deacetylase
VGLEPIGFVPPAWLACPELEPIVREAGLAFTEDTHAVMALARGQRIPAPATCWSTRRAWRRAGSVAVAAARLRLERTRPLVRIAFHPPDAQWPGVLTSCRRTLAAQLERRHVITYRELIARRADPPAA